MPSDLPLVHLYPASVVEPGGEYSTYVSNGQTKSDQGRKASVESLSTPPSRAGRDASSGKKPQLCMLLFSLLQMEADSSRTTILKCILKTGTSLIPRV